MPRLPNKEFRQMVPLLREKGFYEYESERRISWPEYNLSHIVDAPETLEFIRNCFDEIDNYRTENKVGKPLTNPKDLAKAILISEALGLPERKSEGWIYILGPFLGIHKNLDDRTVGEAYCKIEVLYLLKQLFEKTKDSDGRLGGDGTGLETTRKQNYESSKDTG